MKSKLNRNIGPQIKKFRIARGWTQQMLADHIGIHRTQISEWETTTKCANIITVKYLKMEGII